MLNTEDHKWNCKVLVYLTFVRMSCEINLSDFGQIYELLGQTLNMSYDLCTREAINQSESHTYLDTHFLSLLWALDCSRLQIKCLDLLGILTCEIIIPTWCRRI